MADSNRGSNVERGNNINFSAALGLLRQATNILAGSSSRAVSTLSGTSGSTDLTPRSNHGEGGETSSTSSMASTPSTASTAQTVRDSAVLSNFRDLFSPYRSVASSSQKAQPQRPKNTTRRANRFVPYKVKETWTHKFFLLFDPEKTILPTKAEKIKLQDAGLGRKKIVFGNKDGAMEVMSKLEEIYPKLKEGAGGFEILRSGVKNELAVVTPPVGGYTVPFLRDESGWPSTSYGVYTSLAVCIEYGDFSNSHGKFIMTYGNTQQYSFTRTSQQKIFLSPCMLVHLDNIHHGQPMW